MLARIFAPAAFGTYKQFFLLYGTLYGLAQLGMAESLYYFVPRQRGAHAALRLQRAHHARGRGRRLLARAVRLARADRRAADQRRRSPTTGAGGAVPHVHADVDGVRDRHGLAQETPDGRDDVRLLGHRSHAVLHSCRRSLFGSLRAVFIGATAFAALRLALLLVAFWREFGREFRVDVGLWREQLAYALPFALAVGVEVIQPNYHQYVVASRFDAATFAIYAVGCLQIPLVDMIMTSTVNVMMVRMAEDATHGRDDRRALARHDLPAGVPDGSAVACFCSSSHAI